MTLIAQQSLYNVIHSQMSKIGVRLATTDEQDRLAGHVCHGQGRADLVVLRVSEVLTQTDRLGRGHLRSCQTWSG